MRVVVTGSAGFIGSHIARWLLEKGHAVAGLDDLSSGVNLHPEDAPLFHVDIASKGWGAHLQHADAIIHCAAYPELRHNWSDGAEIDRERLQRSNVEGTMRLLEMAIATKRAIPIVMMGTASVYGARPGHVFREEDADPETMQSPYAATKYASECLLAAYAHHARAPWHVARLVNVCGARQHRGVIVDFARMARAGHIHAADRGHAKHWIHVFDVAEAVETMLSGKVPNGVYNVSSDQRVSYWDVVDAMGIARSEVTFEERDGGATGDPVGLAVSVEKLAPYFMARRPVKSGIREALASMGWRHAA